MPPGTMGSGYSHNGSGFFPPQAYADNMRSPFADGTSNGSYDHLALGGNLSQNNLNPSPVRAPSVAPTNMTAMRNGDYGLGSKGDTYKGQVFYNAEGQIVSELDPDLAEGKKIEERPISFQRKIWVFTVWALTWWIPSPLLKFVGRMKRPDVRMAWREKFALCLFILLINAIIVFWIIFFGRILCPNFDKAWTQNEIQNHQGEDDFWVSIHGKVYDITKFWRLQHSDNGIDTTSDVMMPLAGLDLSPYFVPPLYIFLEKIAFSSEDEGFLRKLLFPVPTVVINLGRTGHAKMADHSKLSPAPYNQSIHPTDDLPSSLAALPAVNSAWSAGAVSRQLRTWRLSEWANRRNKHIDYTADFDHHEFTQRYRPLGCMDGRDGIESWVLERGWSNGEVVVGNERVWMRESAWWEAESMLDLKPMEAERLNSMRNLMPPGTMGSGWCPTPEREPEKRLSHLRTAAGA